ncbi:MAG: hypothetical protein IJW19_04415 [Clostridia bacterium]|nr:hypothetical protein [Clostridia bacterium]
MEDKFSQLEMDVGDVERVETELFGTEKERKPYRRYPSNMKIDESQIIDDPEEDSEIELVSPNEEIFKKVSGSIRRSGEDREIPDSAWNRKDESGDYNPKFDDTYANTTETEHSFMKTFGMLETRKSVSMEETNQTTKEIEALQGDIHSDYYEYTDRQQRKEIIGMYKYAKRSIKIKMIIASVFAVMLLFLENISFFSKSLYDSIGIGEHPYIFFFVDLGILLACMGCAYEQLYYGGRSILAKEHIPESISVYACLISIAYSLITLIFVPFGFQQKLYNFPVAFVCVLSLVYSYTNVIREKYGFSVVSSKDAKFVINKLSSDDAETEYETFTTTGDDISGNINIVKIDKANFVKGYFARTNQPADVKNAMDVYSLASLIAPLVLFVIAIIRGYIFTDALAVWYEGFLLALPVGFLFTYSIPFLMGNKKLFNDEVAIIGEDAIKEFSDIRVVSVNDTTAFPPYNVKLQNFKVYSDFNIEKVLYYAASGFSVVGGPLADVFDLATRDAMQKSKRTKFICGARSYFCVKVDNDTLIFADRYGMASQGIDVPVEKDDTNENLSIMFMACNGTLCAKMYINYMIDVDFAETVRTLNKNGTAVMIRTFDPNINNEIIKKQTIFKKSELCVIKLNSSDQISKTVDKIDSGIVSKGRSRSLLKAIPVCKNITKTRKASLIVKVISSLTGLVLLGLTVFGLFGLTPFVPPVFVGLFYIPWMLLTLAISGINLSRIR